MIYELYSIYDRKLGEFLPPMCCKNESDAIRACSQLVNFSDSLMNRFPEDYYLEKIATFYSQDSKIEEALDSNPIEFSTLVKDETKKYTDILKHIELESSKLDSKQMLFDSKLNQVDSIISQAQSKVDKLDSKTVDTPDFLPTNNTDTRSKKSILERLFN